MAVELIRADMLARAMGARRPPIAYRDATLVSIQFGLGLRNQEVYGMRWSALERERAHIVEVLSWNQLDEWGKTEHATGRAPKSVAEQCGTSLEMPSQHYSYEIDDFGHRPSDKRP
jgi:hypothetical protein